jgi:hypothetical protein
MAKYLYGAAVQGIQGFIFQTSKLKEIAGASELVEQICSSLFASALGKNNLDNDPNAILTAAGNIKYIFNDEETAKGVIRNFPRMVMEFAPGITISQGVVPIEGQELSYKHIEKLEAILRAQRNRATRAGETGLLAALRSRSTGLPAVKAKKGKNDTEYYDLSALKKIETILPGKGNNTEKYGRLTESFFGTNTTFELPVDLEEMVRTKGSNYGWLAVIHADGNNMGLLLQKLAAEMIEKEGKYNAHAFRDFSLAIDAATKRAAQKAYAEFLTDITREKQDYDKTFQEEKNGFPYKTPFRPIVLGGDDITIICRADLALKFTKLLLQFFEQETLADFSKINYSALKNGITACAGIAFVKYSFPFHYAYALAESLCSEAKKTAKDINSEMTPSCLVFHKVQDSFVTDYSDIKHRELMVPGTDINLNYGPYFLREEISNGYKSIGKLMEECIELAEAKANPVKSHLRQWLTDIYTSEELARQKTKRMLSSPTLAGKLRQLGLTSPDSFYLQRQDSGGSENRKVTPVFDWLSIHSITEGGK